MILFGAVNFDRTLGRLDKLIFIITSRRKENEKCSLTSFFVRVPPIF